MDQKYLSLFREITYAAPVETIADNHPVYCNGTKLINGNPFLSNGQTDNSRIEELTKIGFSKDYIRLLTDAEFNHYYECSKGKKCNYGSTLPYKPSYSKIGNVTELHDPDNYDIIHTIEIKDYSVYFNGSLIASAPVYGDNKKKKTLAQQLTFCKSIVWAIDPSYQGYVKRNMKNKHGNMEYMDVPDDLYFRELIAKYPAVNVPQKEAEEIAIDPLDHLVENITLSPYPGMGILEASMTNQNWLEIEDREYATAEIKQDIEEDQYYPMGISYAIDEYNPGVEEEMYSILFQGIVQKWVHAGIIITEECLA